MEREFIDYTKAPESRLSDNCFLDEWPECGVLTDRMLDAKNLYKLTRVRLSRSDYQKDHNQRPCSENHVSTTQLLWSWCGV